MRAAAKPIPEHHPVEVFSVINLFYFYFFPPFLHTTKTPDKNQVVFGKKERLEKEMIFFPIYTPLYHLSSEYYLLWCLEMPW